MRLHRPLLALTIGLGLPLTLAARSTAPAQTLPPVPEASAPAPTAEEQQLQALQPLSDLIAEGESVSVGDYNAANNGRAMDLGKNGLLKVFDGRDCSDITIGEIMLAQSQRRLHAAGRYQIIGRTMPMAVRHAGLTGADLFTPENQDRLFLALIKVKRPAVWAYITGFGSQAAAADALSREWSSIPYWDNRSYYGHGDRSHVPRHEVLATLDQVRAAFALFG